MAMNYLCTDRLSVWLRYMVVLLESKHKIIGPQVQHNNWFHIKTNFETKPCTNNMTLLKSKKKTTFIDALFQIKRAAFLFIESQAKYYDEKKKKRHLKQIRINYQNNNASLWFTGDAMPADLCFHIPELVYV